jgi:hypothetical protein
VRVLDLMVRMRDEYRWIAEEKRAIALEKNLLPGAAERLTQEQVAAGIVACHVDRLIAAYKKEHGNGNAG